MQQAQTAPVDLATAHGPIATSCGARPVTMWSISQQRPSARSGPLSEHTTPALQRLRCAQLVQQLSKRQNGRTQHCSN
eukprot:6212367-Pleurochrysis_carterae.AAC.2